MKNYKISGDVENRKIVIKHCSSTTIKVLIRNPYFLITHMFATVILKYMF